MKVVWRANAHVVNPHFLSLQLVEMTIEALELSKKVRIGKIRIDHPDVVELIECCKEIISRVAYCLEMTRCDVAGDADKCKVFHVLINIYTSIHSPRFKPWAMYQYQGTIL